MKKTNIPYCDFTWNPWTGCHKVSEGCANCYMFREQARFHKNGNVITKTQHNNFYKPQKIKEPSIIMVCSYSDFFIQHRAADEWRAMAWHVIKKTPRHIYIIWTKRVEKIEAGLPDDWGKGYENVILGFSAENQEQLIKRAPIFEEIKAKTKAVSLEPLLSNIDFVHDGKNLFDGIDWIVAGGESGNESGDFGFRECDLEWLLNIKAQATKYKIAFYMKQMGSHLSKVLKLKGDRHGQKFENFPDKLQSRKHAREIKK